MSEHTQGPLYIVSGRGKHDMARFLKVHNVFVAKAYGHSGQPVDANAARLVACWNACEGIPTDMLEAMPSGPASLLPMYARLEQQRDELLAMVEDVVNRIGIADADAWWLSCPDRGGFDVQAMETLIDKIKEF